MKLSMHRHFILLAIAILFEVNKVGSSWRLFGSNRKCTGLIFNTGNVHCGGHRAKTCSQCTCNQHGVDMGLHMAQDGSPHGPGWCNRDCQWRRGACRPRRPHNECAGAVFNTGNVICGRHRAKTCSQCPCNQQGGYETFHGPGWCNGDCQWSNGVCHMRQKINKGEWHSRKKQFRVVGVVVDWAVLTYIWVFRQWAITVATNCPRERSQIKVNPSPGP